MKCFPKMGHAWSFTQERESQSIQTHVKTQQNWSEQTSWQTDTEPERLQQLNNKNKKCGNNYIDTSWESIWTIFKQIFRFLTTLPSPLYNLTQFGPTVHTTHLGQIHKYNKKKLLLRHHIIPFIPEFFLPFPVFGLYSAGGGWHFLQSAVSFRDATAARSSPPTDELLLVPGLVIE